MIAGAKDYGAIMRGHAYGILERVFGAEWIKLDSHAQALVAQDYLDAESEDKCGAREYARRIGRGNLASYAQVMAVRERQGWTR